MKKNKFKNLEEIISLCKEELEEGDNDEIGAYFDYEDLKEFYDLFNEFKKIERENKIKEGYLELIHGISFDYDGCNTIKSLKELIDELDALAVKALKNDDKSVMYWTAVDLKNGIEKGKNVLFEEVETDEKS